MKNQTLYFILYIVTASIFTSCENEIPYNPQQKGTQLIMNALLDMGETENYVYLNLSGMQNIWHVEEAAVTFYINGQKAETAEAIPLPTYPNDQPIPEILKQKIFRLKSKFNPGDILRLEATAENGKYLVSSEVKVPFPIDPILKVDTCLTLIKNKEGWGKYYQFKISFNDRPNESNYYRLDIRRDVCIYGKTYDMKDTIGIFRETDLLNRDDVILTDGRPTTSDDDDNGGIVINIPNKYNIFTDRRFSNTNCLLKVYTPYITNFSMSGIQSISRVTKDASVRILSITEAEYRYLKVLNCLESGEYNETLMEPVIIPSNVKGGLGFVGVCSEVKVNLRLSDVNWNDIIYTK